MTYIALEQMRVGDEVRQYGDPIPEAAEWPWTIRDTYLRNHRITEVADTEVKTVKARKAE